MTGTGAPASRVVLVTGAGGQLGHALMRALARRGATAHGLGRSPAVGVDTVADLTDAEAVRRAVETIRPTLVIHAGAYTDVDGCERDPARAEAVNARGSAHVAGAARAVGAHLLMVSTDFVFAGDGGAPYAEDAPPRPLSVYGRSKLAGEHAALAAGPAFAVARTAWLYGGAGKHFPRTVLTVLRDRGAMEVVTDEVGSPTFADDLAEALIDLAVTEAGGVFHLVNAGATSRFELARAVTRAAGLDPSRVRPTTTEAFLTKYPLPARRPAESTLANTRAAALGIVLRPWDMAVAAYVPGLAAELGLAADPPSGGAATP